MTFFNKERALTPSWDLLSPSVELLKKNLWSVIYLSFLPGLFISVGGIMLGDKFAFRTSELHGHVLAGAIILAAASIWELLAFPGYAYMQAQAAKGLTPPPLECLKKGLARWFPLIGMGIAAGIAVALGFIALVIPGLILLRGFYLAQYYVVDQKLGPLAALEASRKATRPVSAWIWGTIGVGIVFSFLAAILGSIPIAGVILSALASYPYTFGAALRYNEIANGINPLQFVPHRKDA